MEENKLVYICSPYRGDTERNLQYARELTRTALGAGYAPITPHLYLTQVTDDKDPMERKRGMDAGKEILKACKYILIGSRYGITSGMLEEIRMALVLNLTEIAVTAHGIEIVYGGKEK